MCDWFKCIWFIFIEQSWCWCVIVNEITVNGMIWSYAWFEIAHQHGCSTKHLTRDWKQTPSGEKRDICGVLLLFEHTKRPANTTRKEVCSWFKGRRIFFLGGGGGRSRGGREEETKVVGGREGRRERTERCLGLWGMKTKSIMFSCV